MKTLFTLVLTAALSCAFSFAETERPPNVIIIMPDDMGYGDLGVTGNSVIRTPNLDLLAGEAAELTDFYVSPVCSPTRACLMTGRYNHRTRCIDTFKGRSMMEPEEWTLAEALREGGYATGIFGKWHLGDNFPLRPQDQGFDEVLIHRGGGLAQPSEPIENERRYTDAILFENGKPVQTKGYCTDVYFDAAIEFMEKSRKEEKPFFVYLPPNAPHGPYHDVPADLLEYYQSVDLDPILNGNLSDRHKDTVARVFAMIENIDQNVGKMDRYLEESGQKENTIVMFFTDNGPNSMRYVGPFRGMKTNVHEGGIRTMFYARWPKGWKAGTKSSRIAAHIDIMPTLLEVAGVKPPEGHLFDGESILPMLSGGEVDWEDRRIFIQSHRGNEPAKFHHFAVREEEWKLVRGSGFGREKVDENVPFELYKIREDVAESKNLADEHPEKLKEMKEAYLSWLEDVSSTRTENYAPPRIRIGDDAEVVTDLSLQDWRVAPDTAGWGASGSWKVDFVRTGPFRVSVKWAQPLEGEREVTLRIGKASIPSKLSEGKTEVVFPEVSVPEGKTDVSVHVGGEQKREDQLRFVTFSRL